METGLAGDAGLPRVIGLEGCSNLRDLGGYRTADGRHVRMGQVFRSASLANLTNADLAPFGALGIRTVCDLRGVRERERAPSRLPGAGTPDVLPLPIEPRVGASLRDLLRREEATGEDTYALLQAAYSAYAGEHLPRYRALFAVLLEERLPLLFHCSAGKDRTGFGAALLLTALGVPRETVVADYLATNRIWRREHALPPDRRTRCATPCWLRTARCWKARWTRRPEIMELWSGCSRTGWASTPPGCGRCAASCWSSPCRQACAATAG